MSGDLAIEIKNLVKSYSFQDQEAALFNGASLQVKMGEFVALLGPSGSGKTTLLNIAGGLDRNFQGEVKVLGRKMDLDDNSLSSFRNSQIGFVFQNYNLFPHLTSLENVMLPFYFSGNGEPNSPEIKPQERALDLLAGVQMSNKSSQKTSRLSGGEQQRVAVARALFNRPAVLLCDEPTGNLDGENAQEILHILETMQQQSRLTILLVTHEKWIADRADRVLRLQDGQIIEAGDSP